MRKWEEAMRIPNKIGLCRFCGSLVLAATLDIHQPQCGRRREEYRQRHGFYLPPHFVVYRGRASLRPPGYTRYPIFGERR